MFQVGCQTARGIFVGELEAMVLRIDCGIVAALSYTNILTLDRYGRVQIGECLVMETVTWFHSRHLSLMDVSNPLY